MCIRDRYSDDFPKYNPIPSTIECYISGVKGDENYCDMVIESSDESVLLPPDQVLSLIHISSVAYGLLQFVIDPVFYSIPQLLVDYPLAFGALGLSGFFHDSKHGLIKGYIVGVLGR